MSFSIYRTSCQYALFSIMVLLVSTSAVAKTINGIASVLDYEQAKEQPKQCLKLPTPLDTTQLHYGDFILLEGGPKDKPNSSFQPQPIALTTNDKTLCFNELKHGYRYHVTFRDGFPLGNGDTFKQKTDSVFSIPI